MVVYKGSLKQASSKRHSAFIVTSNGGKLAEPFRPPRRVGALTYKTVRLNKGATKPSSTGNRKVKKA